LRSSFLEQGFPEAGPLSRFATSIMQNKHKKQFIARAMYHHRQTTDQRVVLIVYSDWANAFELFDTRQDDGYYISGDKTYVLGEWQRLNQELVEEDFRRDDLRGENDFRQFI
jgi:hypothetical protein